MLTLTEYPHDVRSNRGIEVEPGLTILEPLGEGATSVVYLAKVAPDSRYAAHGEQVAVKLFRRIPTGRHYARFEVELKIGLSLNTERVVRYLGTGTFASALEQRPYIVMELVKGFPLAQSLAALNRLPATTADAKFREILESLLKALSTLHERGIVHRDLQPSNVMIRESGAVLLDLGISKYLSQEGPTSVWEELGTRRYWAPECLEPTKARWSPATDIFMMGSCLLHCLSGRYLFSEALNYSSFYERLSSRGSSIPAEFGTLPGWLSEESRLLLFLMLEGDPARRPAVSQLMDIARKDVPHIVAAPGKNDTSELARLCRWAMKSTPPALIADIVRLLSFLAKRSETATQITTDHILQNCPEIEDFELVNVVGELIVLGALVPPAGDPESWYSDLGSRQWLSSGVLLGLGANVRELWARTTQHQQDIVLQRIKRAKLLESGVTVQNGPELAYVSCGERHFLSKAEDTRTILLDLAEVLLREMERTT